MSRLQQERFDALLDEIHVPRPFTMAQLRDRIEVIRRRPLVLVPFTRDDPEAPSGFWLGLPEMDLVFHEERTSLHHQDHIIRHEYGHILCRHSAPHAAMLEFLTRFLPPSCDPARVQEAFGFQRCGYDTEDEREAEAFARHVGTRLSSGGWPAGAAGAADPAVKRALSIFGPRR